MFKSETGMTLTEYITKIRLEKAKSIILETGAGHTEVAEKVGYSDVSYFSKSIQEILRRVAEPYQRGAEGDNLLIVMERMQICRITDL